MEALAHWPKLNALVPSSLTVTLGEATDRDAREQLCSYLKPGFCVGINGVDYAVHEMPGSEGISVQAWDEAAGAGEGPVRLLSWVDIDHIHIY